MTQLLDPHDGEQCQWQAQFGRIEHASIIVGVHEYVTTDTIQSNFRVVMDESPGLLASTRTLTTDDLLRMQHTLTQLAQLTPDLRSVFEEFARFTGDLLEAIGSPNVDLAEALDTTEPPQPEWPTTYQRRRYMDVNKQQYTEVDDPAESLARAKVTYTDTVLGRLQQEKWQGSPPLLDPLLAAAAEAGLDTTAAMRAIATPATLDECPRCRTDTRTANGARGCPECGWEEETHRLTDDATPVARADAKLARDREGRIQLSSRSLPRPDELPAAPFILDATATEEKIRALFDRAPAVIETPEFELPHADVVQVTDGQYHRSTIKQSKSAQRKIQNTIDMVGEEHERPLFILGKRLLDANIFDFPERGDELYYHNQRGLDRTEYDAVVVIGAPHPNIEGVTRDARLLTMHRDDLSPGGVEYSDRRTEEGELAGEPARYRKYNYTNEDGEGREVRTKEFSGLVGALFREGREKELTQGAHRIRPVLADETDPKSVYLLTNVPTSLPVDQLVSFEELRDPMSVLLPEGPRRLLAPLLDAATGQVDGFRPDSLVTCASDGEAITFRKQQVQRLAQLYDIDVSLMTINRWVNALEDAGVIDAGDYEYHDGVPYTAAVGALTSTLQVLSSNPRVNLLTHLRRLQRAIHADGAFDWVDWAVHTLGLAEKQQQRWDSDPPPAD
jgi:uncharacterized Zn finger protein (UPF0148 family)